MLLVLLTLAAPAASAASDFYSGLLRRGIMDYGAGRNEQAIKELRIAAFGLLDSVPEFEMAQVHIALASNKLKRETDTRNAIQRILNAERLEKRYSSLDLSGATRVEFEAVAKKLLTTVDFERLHGGSGNTGVPPEVGGNQRSLNDPKDHRDENQPVPQPEGPSRPTPAPVPVTPAPTTQPARPTPTPTPRPAPVTPTPQPMTQPAPVPRTTQPQPSAPAPQTSVPRTTPATPTPTPAPQSITPRPVPAPAPMTAQPQPAPQTATPRTTTPAPQPVPQTPAPRPAPATVTPAPAPTSTVSPERRMVDGDKALARNDLPTARTIYRELLDTGNFDHAGWVRLAEGLYRARSFGDSLRAFERSGGLRKGEEPYHFYMAVALYETGRYDDAKRELATALPYIEVTPDVARYRAKIEGAID